VITKVRPYRSFWARKRHDVYHDRADCPTGRLIHSEELATGTGGLPRCEQCRGLEQNSSAGSAGIPI
jgi:hypothetical protein